MTWDEDTQSWALNAGKPMVAPCQEVDLTCTRTVNTTVEVTNGLETNVFYTLTAEFHGGKEVEVTFCGS